MPIGWALGAAALAGVASSAIGASGAESAASTQAASAQQAAQVQQNIFNTTQSNLSPWISGGGNALAALQRALGLTSGGGGPGPSAAPGSPAGTPSGGVTGGLAPGSVTSLGNGYSMQVGNDGQLVISNSDMSQQLRYPAGTTPGAAIGQFSQAYGVPASAFNIPATPGAQQGAPVGTGQGAASPYGGFQSSPGYQFQLDQGTNAVQNSAAARGGLVGGNTLKALQSYGTGLANQDWYNYLNQLTGLSNTGENAAANLGNTGVSAGANIGNALIGAGTANAAGTVGATNAITSGIGNLSNIFGSYQLSGGGGGNAFNSANNASMALGPAANSNFFAPSYGYGGFVAN